MSDLKKRTAYFKTQLNTREEAGGGKYIEGYCIVYNAETKITEGYYEQIAPGAADKSIRENDIRCLLNHNTDIVLGRNRASTLKLTSDEKGVFASCRVNENDTEAMNAYARVSRGDVGGWSFGFYPISESYTEKDGDFHYTVEELYMSEVSVCTFPAYKQTDISARSEMCRKNKEKEALQRKAALKKRLEDLKNVKTTEAQCAD